MRKNDNKIKDKIFKEFVKPITRDKVFLMIAKILTSDDYIERANIAVKELEGFGLVIK